MYYDGRAGDSPGQLNIIRDAALNIDYIINRQFSNCTVIERDYDAIILYFHSLEGSSDRVAELATPPELLLNVPLFPYAYEGVTTVRGVTVDAWIGLIPVIPYEFTTPGLAG